MTKVFLNRGKGQFKNHPGIVRIYLQYPFMSSNHLLEELYDYHKKMDLFVAVLLQHEHVANLKATFVLFHIF